MDSEFRDGLSRVPGAGVEMERAVGGALISYRLSRADILSGGKGDDGQDVRGTRRSE